VFEGHMVLDLVAGDEPQLAIGALADVCIHGLQCRAATFPADDIR
jgi:hypothetical protein